MDAHITCNSHRIALMLYSMPAIGPGLNLQISKKGWPTMGWWLHEGFATTSTYRLFTGSLREIIVEPCLKFRTRYHVINIWGSRAQNQPDLISGEFLV